MSGLWGGRASTYVRHMKDGSPIERGCLGCKVISLEIDSDVEISKQRVGRELN